MVEKDVTETIGALPPALQEALGMVATGGDGWVQKSKLKALEKRGLIEGYQDQIAGNPTGKSVIDRLPLNVTRYSVPLPIHIAWAEWCSTQVSGEDV